MQYQYRQYILLFVFILTLTGCVTNIPLKGKVTYKDGTPVTKGTLNFSSEKLLSRAKIQSDGSYVVGTLKETDGIPKGTYKVYISGAEEAIESKTTTIEKDSMGNPVSSMATYRQLVDRKYMTAESTPLMCDVPAPNNRFDIIVEKPAK
ncbi:MAG: hypothetical protein LBU65_05295 [Planctomycetaceae bacterium]|jgi:hypothetical protein|nr:hypothetical protein [Planctomycetaceae bacterium]